MFLVISPAKTLDFEFDIPETIMPSSIVFSKEAKKIMKTLRKYRVSELTKLMDISSKLASLNFERNQVWKFPFDEEARPALLAFKGEVYVGLNAQDFTSEDFNFVQQNLRILSGLYGILKPNDLIMPYRLEMGTSLQIGEFKNLYEYWGNKITDSLKNEMKKSNTDVLVNLASNEYFKSINTTRLKCRIITPEFKDFHNGEYKIISFFAKKARGQMVRFITERKMTIPDEMKLFDVDGYYFNDMLSNGDKWVFTRG